MTADLLNIRPPGGFGLIMADPPWRMRAYSEKGINKKSARGQYDTMTLDEIKAMPVEGLASSDSLLWLWAINPMLPEAIDVMEAWGFQFKTAGHWAKTTTHGKQAFGTGYILRCAGEPFLIGTRGRPRCARNVRSVIIAQLREHSRKPDEAFRAAERLRPDVRRLELFSRQARKGWDVWGNQVGHFEPATIINEEV